MSFDGCNDFNGVGEEPYGRLLIENLTTPPQVKDSGSFKFEVYKSVNGVNKMIAHQWAGGFLKQTDLQPGIIKGMKMIPLNAGVGNKTGLRITFTTDHSISYNGMIKIVMPENVKLGKVGTKIKITAVKQSITATEGTVRKNNIIEIVNVFGTSFDRPPIQDKRLIDFKIEGTQNPKAVKDAGGW